MHNEKSNMDPKSLKYLDRLMFMFVDYYTPIQDNFHSQLIVASLAEVPKNAGRENKESASLFMGGLCVYAWQFQVLDRWTQYTNVAIIPLKY